MSMKRLAPDFDKWPRRKMMNDDNIMESFRRLDASSRSSMKYFCVISQMIARAGSRHYFCEYAIVHFIEIAQTSGNRWRYHISDDRICRTGVRSLSFYGSAKPRNDLIAGALLDFSEARRHDDFYQGWWHHRAADEWELSFLFTSWNEVLSDSKIAWNVILARRPPAMPYCDI